MGEGDWVIRWRALTLSLSLVLAVAAVTGSCLSTRGTPTAMIVAHGLLFIAGLAVWLSAIQAPPSSRTVLILLLAAIAARALLLPLPPSDDVNRYLWEGRLVLAGENPYTQPAALAAEHWRDALWAGMNNRDKLTAYPPLAELVFAAGAAIGDGAWPLKLTFVAAELATLWLVLRELRRRHLPVANLALAAFSPVLLLATAGEAHFDSLFVLATLQALRAQSGGRHRWAWAWLAIAIQLKVVAILLLPILCRRGGWRRAWMLPLVALVPALPFLGELPNLARGILAFGTGAIHNAFLPAILRWLPGDPSESMAIGYALLALWTGFIARRVDDPFRAAFLILAALLLLSPVTHVWYFSWIVPFLALMPQPAWLLLTGLQAFYFTAWVQATAGRGWVQPEWAWWAQWAPFAILLIGSGTGSLLRLLGLRRQESLWPAPRDVSVVMPVYNEGERVDDAVRSLSQQSGLREIIVVDGGSADRTREQAIGAGARVVSGARGRGHQIAVGIAVAKADVIWIAHADVSPAPNTAEAILGALRANPAAAGGAAGQRYARFSPLLLTIEGLNAARSALFGVSFGDQGQFVRRAALLQMGGFPDQPLMEDVELSLQLRRLGPVLHLGANGVVSTRRWDRDPALQRIGLVIRLTAKYLVSTNKRKLSDALYRAYYPMNEK